MRFNEDTLKPSQVYLFEQYGEKVCVKTAGRFPCPLWKTQGGRAAMEGLEEKFRGLSTVRRCRRDDATYVLQVALASSGPLAASCSDFSVRLHDRDTLVQVGERRGHAGPLSGLVFSCGAPHLLFSGSADGTVKGWDVRLPGTGPGAGPGPEAGPELVFKSSASHSFSSLDLSCGDTLLCAGTDKVDDDAFLVFWDVRKASGGLLGVYSESHSDDITQVRFHPRDKDRLASGSADGLVNVFDLSRGSEDEALVATCNADSPAGAVCWAGADHSLLLSLGLDEGLRLWDLSRLDTDQPLALYGAADARALPLLPDGGGVDYLVGGAWLEEEQKLLVVGGMNGGDLHLMECDQRGLRLARSLKGGHASTVRCFLWDPAGRALVTGGEDAQLLLWKPGGAGPAAANRESLKSRSALRLKSRPHKKHEYQRERMSKS